MNIGNKITSFQYSAALAIWGYYRKNCSKSWGCTSSRYTISRLMHKLCKQYHKKEKYKSDIQRPMISGLKKTNLTKEVALFKKLPF